ncbi:MAG TPA: ATP-binding protein [Candidatus Elarobacter sp.]|jgi:anti-sigma regulatory factor (Ser/Thr protein kinase)|nr:ATP-binding protein [Candidatus Elarobacter sp.]
MRITGGGAASIRLSVPPEARSACRVRECVAEFLATHCVPDADAQEFLSAVSEAFANAIEHARTARSIEVACRLAGGERLVATIVDDGVGFDAAARMREAMLPHALAERGRGLPIMQRYTDHFEVRSTPGAGTSVILERLVRRAGEREDEDDVAS